MIWTISTLCFSDASWCAQRSFALNLFFSLFFGQRNKKSPVRVWKFTTEIYQHNLPIWIVEWWNCFIKVESQHLLKQMATITCSLIRSNGWAVDLLHLHIKTSVWLSILPFPLEGNMRLHFDHLHVNKKSSFMITWNRDNTQLIALIWSSAALEISFLT